MIKDFEIIELYFVDSDLIVGLKSYNVEDVVECSLWKYCMDVLNEWITKLINGKY